MKKYLIYKRELESLHDVNEAVKIVEKAAAAHIHFLKVRSAALGNYRTELRNILRRLSLFYAETSNPLLSERAFGDAALVVISGDKGMVGGLYHTLVNQVIAKKSDYQRILVIGGKAHDYLAEENISSELLPFRFEGIPTGEEMAAVSDYLFKKFGNEEFRSIDILYPTFSSITEQKPLIFRFLPFDILASDIAHDGDRPDALGFPIFEPDREAVFSALFRKYVNVVFADVAFESKLAEFSARTVVAENASSKTKELITKLNLQIAKDRQAEFTQKQLESFTVHRIVTGT